MKKDIIKEIVWLVALLLVSLLIYGGLFYLVDFELTSTLHSLQGGSFLEPLIMVIILTFLGSSFFVFGARIFMNQFKQITANFCFIALTGLLIFFLTDAIKLVGKLGPVNYVIFPPASAIPTFTETEEMVLLNHSLMMIQLFLIAILVYISVITGRNMNKG